MTLQTEKELYSLPSRTKDLKCSTKHLILNCEFTEAKGEELEGEALYDFAVCLDIVHDCPFPDRILSTLCRLLKRKHSDQ